MFGHGKCPKCDRRIDHAELDEISVGDKTRGPLHRGVSVVCPYCQTILGATIDPISLKADLMDEILEALGKPRRRR